MYYKNPHGEYVFRDGYFENELDLKDVPVQLELNLQDYEDTMPVLTDKIKHQGKTWEEWQDRFAEIMSQEMTDF